MGKVWKRKDIVGNVLSELLEMQKCRNLEALNNNNNNKNQEVTRTSQQWEARRGERVVDMKKKNLVLPDLPGSEGMMCL